MRRKIAVLLATFLLLYLGISARLFWWQAIKGAELSKDARSQYNSAKFTQASRGNILGNDGSYWVVRKEAWLMFFDAKALKDSARRISEKLAPFFVPEEAGNGELLTESQNLEEILSKKGAWIPIKHKVNSDIKKNIEALGISGLGFENEEDRYYPEASSAAQILGFVGKNDAGENTGYFGLEGFYNLPLSGKSGLVLREKDALGSPILLDSGKSVSATEGVDLVTYLDKRVQLFAEEKLKEGIQRYGAIGGSVTVMDPKTGGILAMASFPSFDPQKYQEYSNEVFKNPVISDSFEPGSIMKVVVMASALDAGAVEPDTECDICDGPLKLDKYFIKTWNNEYNKDIKMTDVIVNSDNTGMSFVGLKLGADKLYEYFDKFGFGKQTGIDLQGEAAPKLRKKGTWGQVDTVTASFGQGVAVTGIQMLSAVAAIANGGYMNTPHVVKAVRGDGWEEELKPVPPVQVIGKEAASQITQMMLLAAGKGESKWTDAKGFRVAGKTGTAQIAVEGHYDEENTNHSFVGFAPAEKPKFVMLVTLKSPQTSPWASETAAPLWYTIAKDLFPYFGIQPKAD